MLQGNQWLLTTQLGHLMSHILTIFSTSFTIFFKAFVDMQLQTPLMHSLFSVDTNTLVSLICGYEFHGSHCRIE